MKILLTTDWNEKAINGVVTSVLNLKTGLTELGHEVRILTLSEKNSSYISEDMYYASSIWAGYIYPKARRRTIFHVMPGFVSELVAWKPDIVHSNCELSTFKIAKYIAQNSGAKFLHTYHTAYEYYFKYVPVLKLIPAISRQYIKTKSKRIAEQTKCVIAPTQKVANLLLSYGVDVPIEVSPSGIELGRFKERIGKVDIDALKSELGIPADHVVLVYVGRLGKEKNLDEIFRLMSRISDLPVTLLVVGGGPYLKNLKEEAAVHDKNNRILFSGMIPQEKVPDYYMVGDLFVSASQSETQGLCYIEALSCGTPLLCKKDLCLDGVVHDGINGWLYSVDEEFYDRLNTYRSMSKKEREQLSGNAIASVDNYSVSSFSKAIEAIYSELLADKTAV